MARIRTQRRRPLAVRNLRSPPPRDPPLVLRRRARTRTQARNPTPAAATVATTTTTTTTTPHTLAVHYDEGYEPAQRPATKILPTCMNTVPLRSFSAPNDVRKVVLDNAQKQHARDLKVAFLNKIDSVLWNYLVKVAEGIQCLHRTDDPPHRFYQSDVTVPGDEGQDPVVCILVQKSSTPPETPPGAPLGAKFIYGRTFSMNGQTVSHTSDWHPLHTLQSGTFSDCTPSVSENEDGVTAPRTRSGRPCRNQQQQQQQQQRTTPHRPQPKGPCALPPLKPATRVFASNVSQRKAQHNAVMTWDACLLVSTPAKGNRPERTDKLEAFLAIP